MVTGASEGSSILVLSELISQKFIWFLFIIISYGDFLRRLWSRAGGVWTNNFYSPISHCTTVACSCNSLSNISDQNNIYDMIKLNFYFPLFWKQPIKKLRPKSLPHYSSVSNSILIIYPKFVGLHRYWNWIWGLKCKIFEMISAARIERDL